MYTVHEHELVLVNIGFLVICDHVRENRPHLAEVLDFEILVPRCSALHSTAAVKSELR